MAEKPILFGRNSLAGAMALLLPALTAVPRARGIPSDFSIRLERTQCFGECPLYSVSIDAAGNVVYEGIKHVRVVGRQSDRVEASRVAALVATVERIGFFQLDDEYRTLRTADGREIVMTDLPTTFVTVTSHGRTKRVKDYYEPPAALRELEDRIDETARTKRWTRIDELMLKELVARGSTPSSSERAKLLQKALVHDDIEVVRVLLQIGTDPNGLHGTLHPLMMAESGAAVRALLDAGADPNATGPAGESPLARASSREESVTEALLQAGAAADRAVDSDGRTALWRAACVGNVGAVNLLLIAGASPIFMASNGMSVLDCARFGRLNAGIQNPKYRSQPPFREDFDGVIELLNHSLSKRKPQ